MRFNLKLFAVSFIFALIAGAFSEFMVYFSVYWINLGSYELLTELAYFFNIISIIISPLIVFLVFYRLGKKYDLPSKIWETVLSVFSGSVIGYYLINIILFNISVYYFSQSIEYATNFYLIAIYGTVLSSFGAVFAIMAGLALGYLMVKRDMSPPDQPQA